VIVLSLLFTEFRTIAKLATFRNISNATLSIDYDNDVLDGLKATMWKDDGVVASATITTNNGVEIGYLHTRSGYCEPPLRGSKDVLICQLHSAV